MKKFLKVLGTIIICICIFSYSGIRMKDMRKYDKVAMQKILAEANQKNVETKNEVLDENDVIVLNVEEPIKIKQQYNDWRLILVNFEHTLPEDFEIELANIDKTRQFDKRAIDELNALLLDAKKAKVGNLWVQSAYRSVERQEEIFLNKVNEHMKSGKTREQAEALTRQYINESNTSEHNLGLAVDFNYINRDFEQSAAFNWLNENAEKYGFILRYRKDKEDITKVAYEPWHWRYVGTEHAQRINEMDFCLEEYIEFLENE